MGLCENRLIKDEMKYLEKSRVFDEKDLEFAISWLDLVVCEDLKEYVGLSLSKTAELLDIGQDTVKNWIAKYGLECHNMIGHDWRVIPVETLVELKKIRKERLGR